MNLKKEGEKVGYSVYDRLVKEYSNLDYTDVRILIDNIYASIYEKIYSETYLKKRGTEYWNGKYD